LSLAEQVRRIMRIAVKELSHELETAARNAGVNLFSLADVTPARSYILKTGGEFAASFSRAVSMAMLRSPTAMEQIKRRVKGEESPQEQLVAFYTYRAISREYLGSWLNQITIETVRRIERAGYRAYPVYRAGIGPHGMTAPFSQKIAGYLSGLGWMGRNCLVINPDHGPRMMMATVLTDAPFETGKPKEDQCGTCRACVEICPANAFTGVPFDIAEPPETRMNNEACRVYCEDVLRSLGVERDFLAAGHVCGRCLYICPFGFKKARENSIEK
jgi:epoxyqueuosine reductase QueG